MINPVQHEIVVPDQEEVLEEEGQAEEVLEDELLVEEISIDGMCGVY
jgi:mycofactocin precursor